MNPLKFFLSLGGAIGICLAITPAQATPLLTSVQGQPSSVMAVRYRKHYPREYGYRTHYRQYNNPDVYATGSNRWWQEMDRLQRGGRR